MKSIAKEYIKTDKGSVFIKVEVCYNKGVINCPKCIGNQRGYWLYVSFVGVEVKDDGTTIETYSREYGKGYHDCIRPVKKASKKVEGEIRSKYMKHIKGIIETVIKSNETLDKHISLCYNVLTK